MRVAVTVVWKSNRAPHRKNVHRYIDVLVLGPECICLGRRLTGRVLARRGGRKRKNAIYATTRDKE